MAEIGRTPYTTQTRIDFSQARSGAGNARPLGGLLVYGLVALLAVAAALFPDRLLIAESEGDSNGRVRFVAWLCAAVLVAPLLLVPLARGRRQEHGLVFDQQGLWWFEGANHSLIEWRDLRGLGVSYRLMPPGQTGVKSAPQRSDRRLELYSEISLDNRYPRLRALTAPPPYHHLPSVRYCLPLPPSDEVLEQIVAGTRAYAPTLWLGASETPWSKSDPR